MEVFLRSWKLYIEAIVLLLTAYLHTFSSVIVQQCPNCNMHFFHLSNSAMFLEILHCYFKGRLEELSTIMSGELNDENESQEKDDMDFDEKIKIPYRTGQMEIDECYYQVRFSENNKLVRNIGKAVHDLRNLGFTSMTEDAYASAIFLLLKVTYVVHFINRSSSLFCFTSTLFFFHSFFNITSM